MRNLPLLLLLVFAFGCTSDPSTCEAVRSTTDVPKYVKQLHKALQAETSNDLEIIELQACSDDYSHLGEKYTLKHVTTAFVITNKQRKSTVARLLIFRSTHEAKREFRRLTEQLTHSKDELKAMGLKRDSKPYFSSEYTKAGEFIFRYKNGIYELPTTCSVSDNNWRIFLKDLTEEAFPDNANLPYLYSPCGTGWYRPEMLPTVVMKQKKN